MNYFKLGDICEVEKGKIGITKAIPGEYPLVTTAEECGSHNEFHFDKPSVIIPLVSSTGHGHASIKRVHYQEGKFAVGSILGVVTPKNPSQLDPQYLFSYLSANKDTVLVPLMKGAANVSLPIGRLKDLEIPVPNLEKQKNIVKKQELISAKSSKLDTIFSKQEELVDKLKQQILQDAITGRLTKNWRKKNPNVESAEFLLEKIKQEKKQLLSEKKIRREELSDISVAPFEIPETWSFSRLGKVLIKLTDGAHHTPTYTGTGIPFLSVKNLSSGLIDLSDTKYISKKDHLKLFKRCDPEYGDILLTKVGTTGIAKVVDIHEEFSLFVSVALLKFNQNYLNNYFIELLINSPFVKTQSKKGTKGMGNQNLVLSTIKKFVIPIPPLEEQRIIVEQVNKLIKKIEQIKKNMCRDKHNLELLEQQVMSEVFR